MLLLTHLTLVGQNVTPAGIEFGRDVTAVCGPSDTGKSFIVNAIDFALGSKALKEIPERQGYSVVLLGLELTDGQPVTLARNVRGGRISVYPEDLRTMPPSPAEVTLSERHSATNEDNLSRYLLSALQLEGKRIRKNVRDETDSLSFRNLAHLCIVDEGQMQSEVQPALSGVPVLKTKELSVLRLLLENLDDSDLVPGHEASQAGTIAAAKRSVIDTLVDQLDGQLRDANEVDLRQQLSRIDATITRESEAMAALIEQRDSIVQRRIHASRDAESHQHDVDEATELHGRLSLLLSQYDSDVSRLETIAQTGSLLGFFAPGACTFCGALPEHQSLRAHIDSESTVLADSVRAETAKTLSLRGDLVLTLSQLREDLKTAQAGLEESVSRGNSLTAALDAIDSDLAPVQAALQQLLGAREEVQALLAGLDRRRSLLSMRSQFEVLPSLRPNTSRADFDLLTLEDFSDEVSALLATWSYPGAERVRYDRNELDLVADGQLRSAHGKGVRAVLHSAFTLGLARYCINRELPHPGFVVLDSPLVTYRAPDESEERLGADVGAAFYRSMTSSGNPQVIILENTDPPADVVEGITFVRFTKNAGSGRYGFFEPRLS